MANKLTFQKRKYLKILGERVDNLLYSEDNVNDVKDAQTARINFLPRYDALKVRVNRQLTEAKCGEDYLFADQLEEIKFHFDRFEG